MGYSEPTTSPSRGSLPMPNDPSLVLPSWLVLPMEMNSQTIKTVISFVGHTFVEKWDLRLLVSEDIQVNS